MIYPQPKEMTSKDGLFKLVVGKCDNLFEFCSICKSHDKIKFLTNPLFKKEEYVLDVSTDGICITSSTDEGFFRALTSLFMLWKTEGEFIACTTVHDSPDFEKRGYMLDISRGRIPKVSTIKKLIDNLTLLKYNEFQLYIESFVFKYPLIPQVTEGFECLTPEDIAEIEEYCNERFIDLVPNQNCLGHMGSWLGRDEYKHLAVGAGVENTGTINPLLEESNRLVENIFDSLLPYFKSDYVNVGLDEAYGLGRYELEDVCKQKGKDVFFMEYLNSINERVGKKHGKKLMFWADMIINYPDSFNYIPKDAIALEWGYELIQSQTMAEHCMALRDKGVEFYVCPSCNTHFSFTGRSDVTTFNLRTAGEVGKKYGAKGYLVTDWACGYEGHPHFPVWSLFPGALGGQYAWNVGGEQTGEAFKPEFIYGAKEFTDVFSFGGKKVSELLYRISNYYLLEPERVHLGSMCGLILAFPLETKGYFDFFDLTVCGDDFYFDNVINYVESILKEVLNIDFDNRQKREIIINGKMVILSAKLCKLRMHMEITDTEAKEIVSLIDWLDLEYRELWLETNFEKGVELFCENIKNRKNEVMQLPRI